VHIIAGLFKGHTLETPRGNVRPTMDKVREAIFAMIRDEVSDSKILDLYAGSGSLGLEAMSEGAKSCDFVDNSFHSIQSIKKNIEKLGISEGVNVHKCSVLSYVKDCATKYDLIFIDPPYKKELGVKTVHEIFTHKILSINGLIILESGKDEDFKLFEDRIMKTKIYGDTKVTILH